MVLGVLMVFAVVAAVAYQLWPRSPQFSEAEMKLLRSLWLGSLSPLPPDPSNAVANDPKAAALGQRLFMDTRLSVNGQVACATCHQPDRSFTDGLAFSKGTGTTGRSAPSVIGTAYSRWMFWDGRKDSQWAQALGPLESPVEHGGTRTLYARVLAEHYRPEYEALFGTLPDLSDDKRFPAMAGPVSDPASRAAWDAMSAVDREMVNRIYANIGKAIAAFERKIMPGESRFDMYLKALFKGDTGTMAATMNGDEVAGMRLFVGKAQCVTCHNGPLMTDNNFYNLNLSAAQGQSEDMGRADGVTKVKNDEFNCLSKYSDAKPAQCDHLGLLPADTADLKGTFRTMTLRSIAETAPYMHDGRFATLDEVVAHYNTNVPGRVLNLSQQELAQLVAFLKTLNGRPFIPEIEQ